MQRFSDLCSRVFESLDQQMRSRSEVGFWSMGGQTLVLGVVESRPANGAWYAEGRVPGLDGVSTASISVAMTPGEVRLGLIMPTSLVLNRQGVDLTDKIATALRGTAPDRLADLPADRKIFDYYFSDGIFSVEAMRAALYDAMMAEMVCVRLGYLVATLWKSMLDIVVPPNGSARFVYALQLPNELSPHALAKTVDQKVATILHQKQDEDGSWRVLVESSLSEEDMRIAGLRVGANIVTQIEEITAES